MTFDFEPGEIKINSATSDWGPFWFNLAPLLPNPTGDPVSSVSVKSWFGTTPTDTSADLINTSALASSGNAVDVWFDYPGATYVGQHWLEFTVTLVSLGVNKFRWGYVIVE